jgi:hypothetical protein
MSSTQVKPVPVVQEGFLPPISAGIIAIQVILGLVVIIILYIVTLVVLNIDSLVVSASQTVKPKEMTKITDGYASLSNLNNKNFNTISPYASAFRKIGRSMNTMGGAQFTYQFWLRIDDANDDLFKDLVILLKGDKRKYNVGYYKELSQQAKTPAISYQLDATKTQKSVYAIAAPLIKFKDSYRSFRIQMNTTNDPLVNIDIDVNQKAGPGRQNLLSLLAIKNWFLMTFVFMDSFSIPKSSEDGIRFIFYINDIPYVEHTPGSMPQLKGNQLKQNDGDLFVFPNTSQSGEFLKIGNINYYNYAQTPKQVRKTFELGPPTYPMTNPGDRTKEPPYISAANKIDIYNM